MKGILFMQRKINLNSCTPFIREDHFNVGEFYGQETVVFTQSQKEFVNRSVFFTLFDSDFIRNCRKIKLTNIKRYVNL